MTGLLINPTPIMTEYLVRECRAFEKDPLVVIDVGARGGLNPEWKVFGDQLRVYCFEPDETECARLSETAPPQVKYLPYALGRTSGQATLYETALPASSGLYKTRMEHFGRFVNWENGVTVSERAISLKTLDEVAAAAHISHVDFIKVDTEGAELDVLAGAKSMLGSAGVLGVLSEIRFHREINGSPPFSVLDGYLTSQGFVLYDIQANRHGRRVLPYPQVSDYRLPSGKKFYAYTTHGQIQDGDALYFRDLYRSSAPSVVNVLKLCALFEVYSLSDCAAELVSANLDRLRPIAPPEKLLDLLASGMDTEPSTYAGYLTKYYGSPSPPAPLPPGPTASGDEQGNVRRGIGAALRSIAARLRLG